MVPTPLLGISFNVFLQKRFSVIYTYLALPKNWTFRGYLLVQYFYYILLTDFGQNAKKFGRLL